MSIQGLGSGFSRLGVGTLRHSRAIGERRHTAWRMEEQVAVRATHVVYELKLMTDYL